MLEEEIAYFRKNLADWMTKYPGRFALVKGSELIGTFETMQAALDEASQRFGLESYLIRQIAERPDDISIPALTMGILSANPSRPDIVTGKKA
jgi:hypothetical protein